MMFDRVVKPYKIDDDLVRALNVFWILHADHEQNCSTTAVRVVGSGKVNLYAAISAGIVGGTALVDLDYSEDHVADVDMNVVMTASGKFLEIQGTGESRPFAPAELDAIIGLCSDGIQQVLAVARTALAEPLK